MERRNAPHAFGEGMIPARCAAMAEPPVVRLCEDQGSRTAGCGEPPAIALAGPLHPSARSAVPALVLPERVLGILRRKWACRVLIEVARGTNRFGELARRIEGLRRPVLAAELHRLIGDELVRKREVSRKPPEVHYTLSPTGSSFCRLLRYLSNWEAHHL